MCAVACVASSRRLNSARCSTLTPPAPPALAALAGYGLGMPPGGETPDTTTGWFLTPPIPSPRSEHKSTLLALRPRLHRVALLCAPPRGAPLRSSALRSFARSSARASARSSDKHPALFRAELRQTPAHTTPVPHTFCSHAYTLPGHESHATTYQSVTYSGNRGGGGRVPT